MEVPVPELSRVSRLNCGYEGIAGRMHKMGIMGDALAVGVWLDGMECLGVVGGE